MFVAHLVGMISCCPFVHKFKRKDKKWRTEPDAVTHKDLPAESSTVPQTQSEVLHEETQSSAHPPRPTSPVSSEAEFFDCKSDFSASVSSPGVETPVDNSQQLAEAPTTLSWHASSIWEFFGWGSSRSLLRRSSHRRSLQQERQDDINEKHQDVSDTSEQRVCTHSASTTTIDASQSRVLTAFSNLVHHQIGASTSVDQIKKGTIRCGSTFERREESCTFEEARSKWEPADATKYRIRSKDYLRSRVKEACKGDFYEVIESDLVSFSKKQNHVAELMDLPGDPYKRTAEESAAIAEYGLPTLLIVNMQLPVYQPSLFGACDGPGHSFVFYCVLREHFNPRTFHNQAALSLLQRFIREGRNQSQYRIKLIPKFLNVDEWAQKGPLTSTEHRLVQQFNEKPILTRPYQHFFHQPNYFEVDVDVHSWLYVARKAFWSLLPRMHEVVTEVAMVIQGNRPEELPEHIIAVARVYRVNLTKFRYISDILKQEPSRDEERENNHNVLES